MSASLGYKNVIQYYIENTHHRIYLDPILESASRNGHYDLVVYLVDDREMYAGTNDNAALKEAAFHAHRNIVEYLIDKGAVVTDEVIRNAREGDNDDEFIQYLNSQRIN